MNLLLTAEQQELRTAVRSFLAANARPRDGHDPAVYRRLNGELGLAGLLVPEEYGGAGAGYAELAVALEETGAALLPGPYLATVFATIALSLTPDKELLTQIAEGRAVTLAEGPGLTGTYEQVLSGMEAEVLVTRVGDTFYAVELDGPGVSRTAQPALDVTRGYARIELDQPPARELGAAPESGVFDRMAIALAAEQLGVMRASLDAIVAYAKIRAAFGRLIGSYQAVKHKLADMHGKLEQAESIVRYAAWTADNEPGEVARAGMFAQAFVGRACFEVARDHLLLHGGIGFTWEHDAHLYYKRAKADEVLLGPPRVYRARLAQLLEL
ncbi:acyl-CoA dehydrogenase family protein [Nonomuraea soli]|uniref:Acyl-CoA dehydrogenase n=1 Tax=Nonomuraea soli TaxID=1032476 RepID=A0A7W0HSU2_9ACTN|nr:acyl-CoA dehydrogenase family protein [Nonomuraea soli]MBA2894355.1 acyl-CoA dehydrogenase [Nonomuraea soli]